MGGGPAGAEGTGAGVGGGLVGSLALVLARPPCVVEVDSRSLTTGRVVSGTRRAKGRRGGAGDDSKPKRRGDVVREEDGDEAGIG